MRFTAYFHALLEDTVDLNRSRLDLLDARVQSIYVAAGLDDELGPRVIDYIPQGSWAHKTIIKPLPGHEFDADFLLQLTEEPEWEDAPKRYISELRAALGRSRDYAEMVSRKNRCVRVTYADDCHVDVVPYIVRSDGSKVIVCYHDDVFEDTDPQGFTAWMNERDDITGKEFRRIVRLLKYTRDIKGRFSCPSVILTTLLGERVSWLDAADDGYMDTPTALKTLITEVDEWLQARPEMPSIEDPSRPGTTFDHRWGQGRYATFRDSIHRYAAWVVAAYDEPIPQKSLELWQKLFGIDFRRPTAAAKSLVPAAPAPALTAAEWGGAAAPNEEFIEKRFPVSIRDRAHVVGRYTPPGATGLTGIIRQAGPLPKGCSLRFTARTDVPKPYRLFWKVRNHGTEAEQLGQLRGELHEAAHEDAEREESTKYAGKHRVDCYIVKDGVVRATASHIVSIA